MQSETQEGENPQDVHQENEFADPNRIVNETLESMNPPANTVAEQGVLQTQEAHNHRHTKHSRQLAQAFRENFDTPLFLSYYQYKDDKKTIAEKMKLDRAGWWFWVVSIFLPVGLLAIFYGVIPLPSPEDSGDVTEYWVFTFIVTPISWTVFGYFYMVLFLVSMGVDRPFRVRFFSVLAPFLATTTVATILVVTGSGSLEFFGLIMYAVTLISVFGSKKIS